MLLLDCVSSTKTELSSCGWESSRQTQRPKDQAPGGLSFSSNGWGKVYQRDSGFGKYKGISASYRILIAQHSRYSALYRECWFSFTWFVKYRHETFLLAATYQVFFHDTWCRLRQVYVYFPGTTGYETFSFEITPPSPSYIPDTGAYLPVIIHKAAMLTILGMAVFCIHHQ